MTAKVAYVINGQEGNCDGPCVTVSESGNTLKFSARKDEAETGPLVHLSSTCPAGNSPEPENLLSWNLIGKSIRYYVDLSALGCGCMAGVYLTGMPSFNSQCPWGYCDATMGQGCASNCQEMDLLMGNSRFVLSNPQASRAGKQSQWGAACRQWPDANKYGQGREIDSSGVVSVMTTFWNDDPQHADEITKIETALTSGDSQAFYFQRNTQEDSACNGTTSLKDVSLKMSAAGMVLSVLNQDWADDSQVTDCKAGSQCNLGGFSLSNIEIFSAGADPTSIEVI